MVQKHLRFPPALIARADLLRIPAKPQETIRSLAEVLRDATERGLTEIEREREAAKVAPLERLAS